MLQQPARSVATYLVDYIATRDSSIASLEDERNTLIDVCHTQEEEVTKLQDVGDRV
jgi:hypothetical protein